MPYVVAAFYHFFNFSNFESMRTPLLEKMQSLNVRGTVLITSEGINSTVSGTREAMDAFLAYLKSDVITGELEHKESFHEMQPFKRAKVRLKKETISIGEAVDMRNVGQYVDSAQWNTLLEDPDTVVIDARNAYETHLGLFQRAIDPKIDTFKELPAFTRSTLANQKHKKIATYCTGGIRCEKFTAWLAQEGFNEVYHLKGGILKYMEEIPPEQSKWQGECYVFDERVAVDHQLNASVTAMHCPVCDHTLTKKEQGSVDYVEGKQCPHCVASSPLAVACYAVGVIR